MNSAQAARALFQARVHLADNDDFSLKNPADFAALMILDDAERAIRREREQANGRSS
jgi:hypothetical protein